MADTLVYFKKLEAAGFSRKQAEAQVEMVTDYYNQNVATKTDLLQLEMKLSKEIQLLREEVRDDVRGLKHDMRELESRITIRLGGMMIVGFGAMAAFIKLVGS